MCQNLELEISLSLTHSKFRETQPKRSNVCLTEPYTVLLGTHMPPTSWRDVIYIIIQQQQQQQQQLKHTHTHTRRKQRLCRV